MSSMMHMDTSYSRMNSAGGPMLSHNIGEITNSGHGSVTVNNYSRPTKTKRAPAPRCPLASPNFIGRTQELDYMSQFFFGEGVLFDQLRILAVIGMGGCGKTQLVRKFMERVYRKFKEKPYLVFYVDVTTITTLQASLASIATANGYQDSSDAALAWMSRIDEPFFLYLDNVDDHTINLRDYFPKSPHARIVITTRLRETKQYTTGRDTAIFLDPLTESEAAKLLVSTAGLDVMTSTVQEDVTQLIQELHCHPLAVVQAGAAIFKVQWTVRDYLERFRKMRTGFMDGKKDRVDSTSLDDYPSHVYSTWKLSYDRLSHSTAQLLGLCAHLHHTNITEEIFRRAYEGLSISSTTPFDLRNPRIPFAAGESNAIAFLDSFANESGWSTDDFRQCIQEACSFSLLSYDVATKIYSIHPLIHDCLRSVAPHPSQAPLLLSATMVPIDKDVVLPLALVPHVHRVLGAWTGWRSAYPPLHPVLANNMGRILHYAGRWSEAEPLARAALDGLTELTHAGHPLTSAGDHDIAALGGADDADTISALANLAMALYESGDSEEPEKMQRQVVVWRERVLGMDHPDTIWALSDLAWTLASLGRYEEAEKMQMQVLDRRRRVLGMDHPDTIRALSSLALTVASLRRYEEAEKMQKQVLEWRRRMLGMDHLHTIGALSDIAWTMALLGRYEQAEKMQKQVLEWRRRVLGMDHPNTIEALNNLALTVASLGRLEEAEEMQKQVLEWRLRILGLDHPDTIHAMSNLGWMLSSGGRYTEAEPLQREALELTTHLLGPDHPHTYQEQSKLQWTINQSRPQNEGEHLATMEDSSSWENSDGLPPPPSPPPSESPSSPSAIAPGWPLPIDPMASKSNLSNSLSLPETQPASPPATMQDITSRIHPTAVASTVMFRPSIIGAPTRQRGQWSSLALLSTQSFIPSLE